MIRWLAIRQGIRTALGYILHPPATPRLPRTYHFGHTLVNSLGTLAGREGRTPQQVAAELLYEALARRRTAEASLRCWQKLSPREQQVTALVCLALTNQEIAARLRISPETVKSHVQNIFTKFGLRHRSTLRLALRDWDFSDWVRAEFP